jgi:hypothetical protein
MGSCGVQAVEVGGGLAGLSSIAEAVTGAEQYSGTADVETPEVRLSDGVQGGGIGSKHGIHSSVPLDLRPDLQQRVGGDARHLAQLRVGSASRVARCTPACTRTARFGWAVSRVIRLSR